jgi:hypothetical protein
MNPTVIGVDLVRGGVLIRFSDGTHFFFGAEFLYAHRSESGNASLPDGDEGLQYNGKGAV